MLRRWPRLYVGFSEKVLSVAKENVIGTEEEYEYKDRKLQRTGKLVGGVSHSALPNPPTSTAGQAVYQLSPVGTWMETSRC